MIIVLWTGCSSTNLQVTQNADPNRSFFEVPFLTINQKIPLIKVTINGKDAWMIVDTGSTLTILHTGAARHYGFVIRERTDDLSEAEINGFNGSVRIYPVYSFKLQIEGREITIQPKAQNISHLIAKINTHESIIIAGILGADVLSRYRMSINYDTRRISYYVKNSDNL